VHDWAGTAAELAEVKPLVGGCINTTLALRTADGQRAVLKISPHRVDRRYQQEAWQLNLLRDEGVPVPQVYEARLGSLEDPFSYLLMEFVDGVNLGDARQQCTDEQFDHLQMHLADLVLRMHERCTSRYGRVSAHSDRQFDAWPAFYRHVYDPIWQEIEKHPLLPSKCRKQIARLHARLDVLLAHDDRPRLVHWDLWSTNLLAAPDPHGRWWITALLDPNCKFAHAEAELAYMDLFGGLLKPLIFGFLVAIVGCHCGLRTYGGTQGVGRSTTQAVVAASILILIFDLFLTRIILAYTV